MTMTCPFHSVLNQALDLEGAGVGAEGAEVAPKKEFPFMPIGQAYDMGHAPDGTPLFDPRILDSAEFARNPYPYYRILRDHYPVYFDKLHNTYWITRYEDITRCYFDEEGFNTIPKGSSSGVLGNTQLELSGVEHRRRRNLYGRHLVGQALEKRIYAIERLADSMIESWLSDSPPPGVTRNADGTLTIELGLAFANEFPIRVVCQVLGIPDDVKDKFFYWYYSMMTGLGGSETAPNGIRARQDLEDYVSSLVELRRREPGYLYDHAGKVVGKDIITQLCESVLDGDYLSTEEITSNIALIVGGGETTRGAIMNMWYLLLLHPEQFAAVSGDEALWDTAFHETLRCASSIGGQPRHNTYDVELHGVTIPAGSLCQMVDFSANHDDRIFADPEAFDIFRSDLYSGKIIRSGHHDDGRHSHMAFGVGPHLCPGAWISHQEAVVGSKLLRRRLKKVSIHADKMPKDIDGVTLPPIGLGAIRELWLDIELA